MAKYNNFLQNFVNNYNKIIIGKKKDSSNLLFLLYSEFFENSAMWLEYVNVSDYFLLVHERIAYLLMKKLFERIYNNIKKIMRKMYNTTENELTLIVI